jgi:hypothetical protein
MQSALEKNGLVYYRRNPIVHCHKMDSFIPLGRMQPAVHKFAQSADRREKNGFVYSQRSPIIHRYKMGSFIPLTKTHPAVHKLHKRPP